MILKYEKISKDNIVMASRIQYKIFPNSSAYLKYLKEIQSETLDLPISFLVFENDIPIGVVGLYLFFDTKNEQSQVYTGIAHFLNVV